MGTGKQLLAAGGGIAVAFLLAMLLAVAARDPELESGTVQVGLMPYSFPEDPLRVTDGSTLVVSNPDVVPHEIELARPDGTIAAREFLDGGATMRVDLDAEGEWTMRCLEHPWMEKNVDVRSANPFTRFFRSIGERLGGD